MSNRIGGNIFKIFTGTFISRIFGFVREMVVAWFFGTSKIADAFSFALIFPNLFRQVLGEDMVERAFMPPFKTKYDRGEVESSWKFLSVVLNWFFIFLLGAMTLLYLITPLVFMALKYFNPGAEFDYDLSLRLIFILMPFMLFIGLAAFAGSLLNFFERNWIFGFAPVMLSVGVVAGIYWLEPFIGGYSIAAGYVLGAVLQFAVHLPFLYSKKFRDETKIKYQLTLKDSENDYKVIRRESKMITLNAVFNKSAEFFDRMIATLLITGSASSLFYSQRIFQLPFAIISLPITRGINPILNKLKSENDRKNFNSLYIKGCDIYFILLLPVTVFCAGASKEIISAVFMRGAFDEESLRLTHRALQMYMLGLIPISFSGYYQRVLSLFSKNVYSMKVSVVSAAINIVLSYILAVYTPMGHLGIALATSVAFYYNMVRLDKNIRVEIRDLIEADRKFFTAPSRLFILGVSAVLVLAMSELDYGFAEIFERRLYNDMLILGLKGIMTGAVLGYPVLKFLRRR